MVRGVALDVDGTLLLSNDAHAHAWVEAFKAFGYDIPYDRIRPLIGLGGDKLMPKIAPGLTTKEGVGKEISERRRHLVIERYAPTLEPSPGARQLVERMREAGLDLVVATSAKSDEVEALLKAAGLDDLLTERITTDQVEESKPAPDTMQVATDRLGLPASEVLMLGDTSFDVESAHRAGASIIALRCGGTPEDQLDGALAVYDDPADLLSHWDESPLAGSPAKDALPSAT
jgi:HAD superfamily hydrolase (TIGR01509 family)